MKKIFKKIVPFKIRKWVKLKIHKGTKYFCPFCSYSSRDLAPIGLDIPVISKNGVIGAGRRFGKCYNCGSIDREKLVYVYLKEKLKLFNSSKEKSILHISPENSVSEKIINYGFKKYICGVLHEPGLSYPDYVENIDITEIPYPENTFDLVLCSHVLEHVQNDLQAMREFLRVLKPGGTAILQVPISRVLKDTYEDFSIISPEQREIAFGQFDHVRIYGQDYIERLEQSEFRVNRINISGEFIKYGLIQDEDLFICVK